MYIATAVHVRVHAQHQWLQNVTCGHYRLIHQYRIPYLY